MEFEADSQGKAVDGKDSKIDKNRRFRSNGKQFPTRRLPEGKSSGNGLTAGSKRNSFHKRIMCAAREKQKFLHRSYREMQFDIFVGINRFKRRSVGKNDVIFDFLHRQEST